MATSAERLAVLETEMKSVKEELAALKRALWATAGSIIVAVIVFALGVASGVIG